MGNILPDHVQHICLVLQQEKCKPSLKPIYSETPIKIVLTVFTVTTNLHFDLFDWKGAGVTNNINNGSALFKCPSKPWQCDWASMHNTRGWFHNDTLDLPVVLGQT